MLAYNFRFEADFLTEAVMRYRRQHRFCGLIIAVKIFMALLLGALAVFLWANSSVILALFFGLLIILLAYGHRIDLWRMRRNFKKSPYANENVTIEISEEGFHLKSPKQDTKLTWAVFTRAVHFQDGFLLFQGSQSFNWIPARFLQDGNQLELLRQLLTTKISVHKIVSPVRADQR